jgi:hypothetical protein
MWRIFSLLLLLSNNVFASEILSIEHFSIDAWKTLTRRDPYQPEYTDSWSKGGQFNFNLRAFEYFSWKNQVHFDGTSSQLQHAGWRFDVSFDKYVFQPFYTHHSQHAFDDKGADDPSQPSDFPLIDRYGMRFVFYGQ